LVAVGVRNEVRALSGADVASLRLAFALAYEIRDERGHGFFAGLHGLPLPSYCTHNNELFLPWHRAYLYFFERALQDLDPGATLPWWDWTSSTSHASGIPVAYRRFAGGRPDQNPLASGPVTLTARGLAAFRADPNNAGAISSGSRPRTLRDSDTPSELPRQATVQRALRARTYADFWVLLEGIHNSVHLWVGGAMTLISVAAYDPIFWAHHAMIDRLWYLWQSTTGRTPPARVLGQVLPPFPMTVRDTLDTGSLGYEYAVRVIK
jgi:tyrosinase